MSDIVQVLWGFCHTLRHDGVDYGDYLEQLTYLLFLKMADERGAAVPKGADGSIFFQKGRPTEEAWIFDARSNVPGITKKDRPLTPQHFAEFEAAYGKDPNGRGKRKESERSRRYPASAIRERQYKLDIT